MARRGVGGDRGGLGSLLDGCLGAQLRQAIPVSWSCRQQGFAGKTNQRFMLMTSKKVKWGFSPFKLLSLSAVCFPKAWWMERVLRSGL